VRKNKTRPDAQASRLSRKKKRKLTGSILLPRKEKRGKRPPASSSLEKKGKMGAHSIALFSAAWNMSVERERKRKEEDKRGNASGHNDKTPKTPKKRKMRGGDRSRLGFWHSHPTKKKKKEKKGKAVCCFAYPSLAPQACRRNKKGKKREDRSPVLLEPASGDAALKGKKREKESVVGGRKKNESDACRLRGFKLKPGRGKKKKEPTSPLLREFTRKKRKGKWWRGSAAGQRKKKRMAILRRRR